MELLLEALSLAFILATFHVTPEVTLAVAPPAPTKLELVNISVDHLGPTYMKQFNPELSFLKISRSKIDKIEEAAFDSLEHLNLLEISDSRVGDEVGSRTFSRLPRLEILVLRNVGLRKGSLNLTHVQELILAQNELENLEGILGGNVNYLDVSNNKLRVLGESLQGLRKLSVIDISKNNITEVGNVFEKNVNLLRILASENKISSTAGFRLPWLKTLDLFDNRIPSLDAESFSKMAALEELVLAFNSIKTLDDPFKDLLELKFLNLAWNHIEEVSPSLFRNNLYLSRLSLQGNKLKALEQFLGLFPHLTQLDLSHNEIALVDDEFFLSTPSLQVLDLSFNRLKAISDAMAPLTDLRVLDLAYNGIAMTGYEFSGNVHLTRVNLSANGLDLGLGLFKNNTRLTHLDVSDNLISDLCEGEPKFQALLKISLRGNQVRNLSCLGSEEFKSLCEVDLRNNPLACGEELDKLILDMANRKRSPHRLTPEPQSDLLQNQCESLSLSKSFSLWNSVKRELCPRGQDLDAVTGAGEEWEGSEAPKEPAAENLDARKEEVVPKEAEPRKKHLIVLPIGRIRNDQLGKGKWENSPQSERMSWEELERHSDIIRELEEEEAVPAKAHYSWYTIALILIGLSLTLTCFNLVVFLYVRLRVWKKTDTNASPEYIMLHNEVYKNTTTPSKADAKWLKENHVRNKIFSFGRMNELLLNFGLQKKEKDSESVQNILISTPTNSNSWNC